VETNVLEEYVIPIFRVEVIKVEKVTSCVEMVVRNQSWRIGMANQVEEKEVPRRTSGKHRPRKGQLQ
jgi:hypothetical protein